MNYQMMKSLVDSLVTTFKCPSCGGTINDSTAEIVGAAGSTLNIDMICPGCGKHTMVRAEMAQINLGAISGVNLNAIKDKLSSIGVTKTQNEISINDKQIIDIKNTFKNENIKVEDFLK